MRFKKEQIRTLTPLLQGCPKTIGLPLHKGFATLEIKNSLKILQTFFENHFRAFHSAYPVPMFYSSRADRLLVLNHPRGLSSEVITKRKELYSGLKCKRGTTENSE